MKGFNYKVYFYPGKTFSDERLEKFVEELREVASSCFDNIPDYQALTGNREELSRAVIVVARDRLSNKIKGFCSALLLPVQNVGSVLHLGLTCVHPSARGKKLTHKLSQKLLLKFLLRESPMAETWISNCACVLSSLGNVAMYFEEIYPSPYGEQVPTMTHLNIARAIDKHYRDPIAINEAAKFNEETFVFEGSVDGTSFQKDGHDKRYHHRDKKITGYYQGILDFSRGDEVLQIGKISLLTFPKYMLKTAKLKTKRRLIPGYAAN